MTYRYSSKNKAVSSNGTTFVHGLGTSPDEYNVVPHGATAIFLPSASAPDATNVYVTAAAGGGTASVFACVNHSIIK